MNDDIKRNNQTESLSQSFEILWSFFDRLADSFERKLTNKHSFFIVPDPQTEKLKSMSVWEHVIQVPPETSDSKFIELYKANFEVLEKFRIAKLKQFRKRKNIAIPLAIAVFFVTPSFSGAFIFINAAFVSLGFTAISYLIPIYMYIWASRPKRQYKKVFKEFVIPRLVAMISDLSYCHNSQINVDKLQDFKILPDFDTPHSEGLFQGNYKGVDIEFSALSLTKEKSLGSGTNVNFHGLCVLLNLGRKNFLGHTVLKLDEGMFREKHWEKQLGMKKVSIVDPKFEKIFDAYSTDQVEARYILEPVMIDAIKKLSDAIGALAITAAWYDSKLLILAWVNRVDIFEAPSIYSSADKAESILTLKNDIVLTLSIVDHLKLYKNPLIAN